MLGTRGDSAISDISPAVKDFVRKHIDSVHQLELLLLLKRYEDRAWSASELARELYTSPLAVEENLKRFIADRLVQVSENSVYRYVSDDHDNCVTELMDAYKHFRVRVIDTIFSKSSHSLKDFSNAFKFRRDEEKQ